MPVICIRICQRHTRKIYKTLVPDDVVSTASQVSPSGRNCSLEYCITPRIHKLRTPVLKSNQWYTGFLLGTSASYLCNLGARGTDANVQMLMLLAKS